MKISSFCIRYFNSAVKKEAYQSKPARLVIKNENLKFDADQYNLILFPFHPEIMRKGPQMFQINKDSSVLSFTFIKKADQNDEKNSWENRKSYGLKFIELAKILEIELEKGRQEVIQRKKIIEGRIDIKKFSLKDNVQDRIVEMKLEELSGLKDQQLKQKWEVKAKLKYIDFRLIHLLVKQSLFDLSGMRFSYDFKKSEELAKIGIVQKQQQEMSREYDQLIESSQQNK